MIDKDKARRICDTACSGAFSAVSECGFYAREALPELLDRVEALDTLQRSEAAYRRAHDVHGDGALAAGRAWDIMRRAGDKARAALVKPAGGES